MGRKKKRKSVDKPDLKYNDALIGVYIRSIMKKGKLSTAQAIAYDSFDMIQQRTKEDPVKVFHKAIENARPLVEVKPRRVGGATYQVPIPVHEYRSFALVFRWLMSAAIAIKGKPMAGRLAQVILETYKGEGALIKKKTDVHKMAEANKAFAHFVW